MDLFYKHCMLYIIESHLRKLLNFIFCSCAIVSGLITSTVILPADVIKTRMMSSKDIKYKSTMDCLMQLLKHEGPTALCM